VVKNNKKEKRKNPDPNPGANFNVMVILPLQVYLTGVAGLNLPACHIII